MLVSYPPIQKLLDADAAGWSRASKASPQWTHTNGLACLVQRNHPSGWTLTYRVLSAQVVLKIPRSHAGGLSSDITPLLHDVARWIDTTDIVPRRRIAHHVAAWLAAHGKTGTYSLTLFNDADKKFLLRPDVFEGYKQQFFVPPEMIGALRADVDNLWVRTGLPSDNRLQPNQVRHDTGLVEYRKLLLQLPDTGHERLAFVASLPSELRLLPMPDIIIDF